MITITFFFIVFAINRHIFLSTSYENLCITYHVKSTMYIVVYKRCIN